MSTERQSWKYMDFGRLISDAAEGIMSIKYKGPEDKYLNPVRNGIGILYFLSRGLELVKGDVLIETGEDADIYSVFKGIYPTDEMSQHSFIEAVNKCMEIKDELEPLIREPGKFNDVGMDDIDRYQETFNKLSEQLH